MRVRDGDLRLIEAAAQREVSIESGSSDLVSADAGMFKPAGIFMLRASVLPLRTYVESFSHYRTEKDGTGEAEAHRILDSARLVGAGAFDEAIAVASPSLYTALSRLNEISKARKRRQATLKVSRYLARMSARPTPFGLFSGVVTGSLADSTAITLRSASSHQKRTRPDMGWLLRVIHDLEQHQEVIRRLRVKANPAILVRGGRAILPYVTGYGQLKEEERTETVSVRFTPVVRDAVRLAQDLVSFEDLTSLMADQYPQAGTERMASLLEQLFRQEFLLSSLRPPLTVASPLDHVIEHLSPVESAKNELEALLHIREAMRDYDTIRIGEGIEAYRSLENQMNELAKEDSSVQIDLALSTPSRVQLHQAVGEEASRAAEILWRLSEARRGMHHLRSYHEDFLDRYGAEREVPVLELLDEDFGLGAPANYSFPAGRRQPKVMEKNGSEDRNSLLIQLAMSALSRGETEVELTEDLVEELSPESQDPDSAPLSAELYVQVVADSQADVDKGEFQLFVCPNPGSNGAGMSFGRFLDILGPEALARLRAAQDHVSSLRPDLIFADLVYQPRGGRSTNVCVVPGWRDYSVVVGTNEANDGRDTLPLNDLVVGATSERLYLRSASLGREVAITANNMLNPQGAPNVCRFLYELGCEGVRMWEPFSWGTSSHSPMLPRIRYGKTVLAPAQWQIDERLLRSVSELGDDLQWEIALHWWREEWRVPRYVYMTLGDQRVLLDLDNPLHAEDLREEIKGGKRVLLQEVPGSLKQQWVQGSDGPHVTEFVFPLVRTQLSKPTPVPQPVARRRRVSSEQRVRLPGSDWLYARLYGSRERENNFIPNHIAHFAEQAVHSGLAHEWFYIRYADPEPHIRLRFRGEPEILWGNLLPQMHEWVTHLRTEGAAGRFSIDAYDREIERYGGLEVIDLAERHFAEDSRVAARLLGLLERGDLSLEAHELAAISIVDLLHGLGLSSEEQIAWILTTGDKEEYRDEFRTRRRKLMDLVDPGGGWKTLSSSSEGAIILDAWALRREATQRYGESLHALEAEKRLWSTPGRIVGSLVHMHCNRLLGIDREAERRAMAFARNTLHSQHLRSLAGSR